MKYNKLLLIILFITLSIGTVNGQADSSNYTRKQVLKYPLISTALNVLAVTSIGLIDSVDLANVDVPWWLPVIVSTQHLPIYKLNAKLGRKYSLIEGSLLAFHYATKSSPTFTLFPVNMFTKTAWYSTYDMYKISRSKAKPGIYTNDWRPYELKELAVAPFKKENLLHPLFYIPVGLSLYSAYNNVKTSDCSIFKKNKAYIDGKEVSMGTAIPSIMGLNMLNFLVTGIGEEVLYRGVIYEELKVSYGPLKAKLFDFFLFPAIHVPMDIASGRKTDYILKQFVVRGFSTLLFDYSYDKGGLPLSIAIHTWFNTIGFTQRWFAEGGVSDTCPEEESRTSASIIPPMSISISFTF